MAVVTKPMALDESLHTTDGNNTNIADILRAGFAGLWKMITETVASGGWTASSYTSPSGTAYAYKKEVTVTGMTANSFIDGDISSGTYTGAYAFESASGKAIIRTATQPSASLTFRIYYQI